MKQVLQCIHDKKQSKEEGEKKTRKRKDWSIRDVSRHPTNGQDDNGADDPILVEPVKFDSIKIDMIIGINKRYRRKKEAQLTRKRKGEKKKRTKPVSQLE